MKEETAKTKRCPFPQPQLTHYPTPDYPYVAQAGVAYTTMNCNGSGCMMWVNEEHTEAGYGHCGLVNMVKK